MGGDFITNRSRISVRMILSLFAIVNLLDHYFHKLGTISDFHTGPLNETPLVYIGVVTFLLRFALAPIK